MSKFEDELRRRLAVEGADVYEIMRWFLDAIGAQACADGGPEPDLSWFEREFLKDNTERYHEERLRRMPLPQLLNEWATTMPAHPDRPLIDVSGWSDKDLINGTMDDRYGRQLHRRVDEARQREAPHGGRLRILRRGEGSSQRWRRRAVNRRGE